ncbi:MAG: hypothetical protein ABIW49_04445 [Knoellia sp.]
MTSKRAYAVAALALSASLPLAACSQAGSTEGEAKPQASAPAYVQPVYQVTHEQAKAIAVVGQRLPDGRMPEPIIDTFYAMDFCHTAAQSAPAEAQGWSATNDAPESSEGDATGPAGSAAEQFGQTHAQVVVLGSSQSTIDWANEKFQRGSTCSDYDGIPLTTHEVAVPGAARSLVRTIENVTTLGSGAHSAIGAARVENVMLYCTADSATAQLVLRTVTSCLTEMAQAVPFAAERDVEVNDANRVVATKMLLARAPVKGQSVTVETTGAATTPCKTSTQTFLPDNSPFARLETSVPLEAGDPAPDVVPVIGVVISERLADAKAAKAKVAAGRKTFGDCKGNYTRGSEPNVTTGKITGVTDTPHGDGGFTITSTLRSRGERKAETVQESVFSVGPYVVEVATASPKDAQAIATRLKAVAGS